MRRTSWTECTLGDLITLQRGYDITKKEQRDGPFPVVSSSGPNSSHDAFTDAGPGVLIGRKGTLGTAFYIDGPFWAHDTTLWVRDFKGNDKKFIFYLLKSMKLASYDVGSSNPTLNRNHLHLLPVRAPSVGCQRCIANVLSVYDDLIEVNQRRIAILEEMARRLFDEWFVRFRFPGHETVEMVETEMGPVPQRWPLLSAEELIAFDPRTTVPKDGEKPYVPMSALDTATSIIDNIETRSGNAGAKFQNGDTLFARITPCLENGKTGLVNFLEDSQSAFGSTEFTVMRGISVPPSFVYLLARSEGFRATAIKSMAGADGRQRVRLDALKGFLLAKPPVELLERFAAFSEPLFQQIQNLSKQNSRLRAARDLLLPKLVSGEIDVSKAEDAFAEAAE